MFTHGKLNHQSAAIIASGLFLYFCVPPIHIVDIDKFAIRGSDLIFGVLFCVCLPVLRDSLKFKHFWIAVFLFSIFSVFWGLQFNGPMQVIYVFRFLQYYFLGIYLFYLMNTSMFRPWGNMVILTQIFISVLQMLEVLPVLDNARGNYYATSFSGTFGNTAQFSYFIFFMLAIMQTRRYFTNCFIGPLLALNGVVFAAFSVTLLSLKNFFRFVSPGLFLLCFFMFVIGVMLAVINPSSVLSVLEQSSNVSSFTLFKGVGLSQEDYAFDVTFLKSLYQRLNKFLGLFIGWKADFSVVAIGCGYGCAHGAVDSGIIRFVFEFGIVGLVLFLLTRKKIDTSVIIVILVGNVFFDAFWSSSTACFIWALLFHGYVLRLKRQIPQKALVD